MVPPTDLYPPQHPCACGKSHAPHATITHFATEAEGDLVHACRKARHLKIKVHPCRPIRAWAKAFHDGIQRGVGIQVAVDGADRDGPFFHSCCPEESDEPRIGKQLTRGSELGGSGAPGLHGRKKKNTPRGSELPHWYCQRRSPFLPRGVSGAKLQDTGGTDSKAQEQVHLEVRLSGSKIFDLTCSRRR